MQNDIMADPKVANEAWVDTLRVAESRGIAPLTRKAENPRDIAMMRAQNLALTRAYFGMPKGYERIVWRKSDER